MLFSYQQIKNNEDGVLGYTLDVYSIHTAFIKIFQKFLKNKVDLQLYSKLTTNNFETNRNYSKILNEYGYYLSFFIQNLEYNQNDKQIKQTLQALKQTDHENIKKRQELIQTIFGLFNLKGRAKDLITLTEHFVWLNPEEQEQLTKMSFDLEPVNGCDLPQ
ncbi:hypothetical protein [Mycoplasmopsis gallopavonis]|uniref:Uncharacterized protein n=1 Tax=Mycoplasmopsis gallopavonis TaxID=76629 RepID=A0A449AYG6_9BACT|nr:hypothetical protein [Mycoplasmopsis gallopavonis]RIV16526.1 hypothetical protein D1113_02025 [Mycoplasmopsis gallopavonis]VEU72578.1 Uncharacterised protein [Mycoplasmopsis gallopavonis]